MLSGLLQAEELTTKKRSWDDDAIFRKAAQKSVSGYAHPAHRNKDTEEAFYASLKAECLKLASSDAVRSPASSTTSLQDFSTPLEASSESDTE